MNLSIRLRRLADRLHSECGKRLSSRGSLLRQRWLPVYDYLLDNGPHPVMGIALATGLSHPAVLQFAQEMIDGGLIASYRDPKDRRKRVLALSASGKQLGEDYRVFKAETNALVASIFEDAGIPIADLLPDLEQSLSKRTG